MNTVDPLVAEFERSLRELSASAGSASEELDALLLVGVEREAMVTVAYHASAVDDRLSRMPIDPEVAAVVSRALRWVWRDEQGHTLWVRGALLRRHEPVLQARALAAQVGGWIGGFVASRQVHNEWRQAPLRRALAEVLESAAALAGRIPPEVRSHLHHLSFRDFCRFQSSAETTAKLGWHRVAELALDPSTGVPPADVEGFRRLAEDEGRHARVFRLLAEAFDDLDRALIDVGTLRDRLAAVGQRFVAVPDPQAPAMANPLGKGAKVVVRQGEDPAALIEEVLAATGADELLRPGVRVVLKVTLQLVVRREDPSPGVSVPLLVALRAALVARGAEVVVLDASNLYTSFRRGRSVREVCAWLGVPFEVRDAQDDLVPHAFTRGVGEETVSATWRDAEVRILLGKLRTHPVSKLMSSLEAAHGLGVRDDELVFADRRAEQQTATLMVLDACPPHLCLLDAWEAVPDGLVGMMGTARPLHPRRLYGSRDGVALDLVVARHAGADPTDDALLARAATDWFGAPEPTTDGPDAPIPRLRLPDHNARTALLSALAWPVWAFAGLRGALFLPDFDDEVFPPAEDPNPVLQAATGALRALVRRVVADDRSTWPGLLETSGLTVGGRTLRVARGGGRGPTFVLLHGYPDDLQVWSALAPLLARHGEVLALDWPGLGRSDDGPAPADPEGLADVVLAALDAAGIERAVLVGHDMGGPPALCLAAKHPDRVERVVVLNSLLFGDLQTSRSIAVMRRPGLAWAALHLAPGVVWSRAVASFLPDGVTLPPELEAELRASYARPGVAARLAAMCSAYEQAFPRLPRLWFDVRCPVLALWAEDDGHFPTAHGRRLCEVVKRGRMVVLPRTRHWMALTDAELVAPHVLTG